MINEFRESLRKFWKKNFAFRYFIKHYSGKIRKAFQRLQSLYFDFCSSSVKKTAVYLLFVTLLNTIIMVFFLWLTIFIFFYIHKKKVLDSRKFPTCGFRCIYTFWGILNTIWPLLQNACLSVCMSACLQKLLDTESQELML